MVQTGERLQTEELKLFWDWLTGAPTWVGGVGNKAEVPLPGTAWPMSLSGHQENPTLPHPMPKSRNTNTPMFSHRPGRRPWPRAAVALSC